MEIQGVDVTNVMTYILNRMCMGLTYTSWSDEYCRKENREAMNVVYEELKKIDFSKITQEEAIILGFRRWSADSDYFLVPIWLYTAIPDGTSLLSIMGTNAVKGRDRIDDDTRAGLMAYQIQIKAPEPEPGYKSDDTIRLDEMEDDNE